MFESRRVLVLFIVLIILIGFFVQRTVYPAPDVRVTFYHPTGSPMASGYWPAHGDAACSPDIAGGAGVFGRRFVIDGWPEVFACWDTGPAVQWRHVDIYRESGADGEALRRAVGDYAAIRFLD